VGTQYRSEIFYHNEEQKKTAEDYIGLMTAEDTFGKRIVTKISPVSKFYEAEKVHQNYYNDNKSQGYCSYVITPKIDKLKKCLKINLKIMKKETMAASESTKKKNLFLGILFDAVNVVFTVPLFGEFSDVIWARWQHYDQNV
jgi:hypothetical protein